MDYLFFLKYDKMDRNCCQDIYDVLELLINRGGPDIPRDVKDRNLFILGIEQAKKEI